MLDNRPAAPAIDQERIAALDARGVAVVLEASHSCMTIRGVRKEGSVCTTSAMRGGFLTDQRTRGELMALIHTPR